jgi:hypothetical protein
LAILDVKKNRQCCFFAVLEGPGPLSVLGDPEPLSVLEGPGPLSVWKGRARCRFWNSQAGPFGKPVVVLETAGLLSILEVGGYLVLARLRYFKFILQNLQLD